MTEAEFLHFERQSPERHEFLAGEVYAMAGATPVHAAIASDLLFALQSRLRNRRCQPFGNDLRIRTPDTGLLTYPDLTVICGPLEFAQGTEDTVTNPTVLLEILSESTEAWDRGGKFGSYRQLPSLREYVLISQHEPRVELFVRQTDGNWLLTDLFGLDHTLKLVSLGCEIPLGEIFTRIVFAPGKPRVADPVS